MILVEVSNHNDLDFCHLVSMCLSHRGASNGLKNGLVSLQEWGSHINLRKIQGTQLEFQINSK